MIFAAVTDIHGNHLALEAVLEDIRRLGIDAIVNLGDCFSGPLEAGKTAEILLGLDLPTVRGNHDRYLVEQPVEAMGPSDAHAFRQLDDRSRDWIRALPFDMVWRDEVYLCHATPQDDSTYWLETVTPEGYVVPRPATEIEAWAAGVAQPLMLCGHTHLPRTVRLSDGHLVVNPGSVGCPAYTDDRPYPHKVEARSVHACYAICEKRGGAWAVTFRQVPYDHMAMAELAAANGRPDWASALATGFIR
ncbi:metallophosphoesterase family protein [Ciceribacter azotifigens]|uniref:metallophosphoesterase family protein n=1 Tax=Ciceribacter azotifigens TaxID=2069303 RepID=UPI003A8A5270